MFQIHKSFKARFFFTILIFTELAIIVLVGTKVFTKNNILGASLETIHVAQDSTFDSVLRYDLDTSRFKFFYEPKVINAQIDTRIWLPHAIEYSINSDSLNERFEYDLQKKPDYFRIITLGDSYTFGHYVNTSDNYPEQLEDLIRKPHSCNSNFKFEVINLGVPGYDLEYSLERFVKRGQKYNPDLIIWFIKADDFITINELIEPKKKQFKKEHEERTGSVLQYTSDEYYRLWDKTIADFISEFGEENLIKYNESILQKFNGSYSKKLLIITLPSNKKIESSLQSFAESRRDTYFLKLQATYDKLEDLHHPTKIGYASIVSQVFNYIKMQNLIPCSNP